MILFLHCTGMKYSIVHYSTTDRSIVCTYLLHVYLLRLIEKQSLSLLLDTQ